MIAAALQYCASSDIVKNCDMASKLIDSAADKAAQLVALPECANLLAASKTQLFQKAESQQNSLFLQMLQAKAKEKQIWISAGSLLLQCEDEDDQRIANRQLIISPQGEITASYDKIHMFDADVGDGKDYRESASFRPGTQPVMTRINDRLAGLSICYDIRFAQLYHHYAANKAELLFIPAAFTAVTGKAHWHVLQRCRAIETGAFVIAAAQIGTHDDGRQTYGHALIIDPWGRVLSDAGSTEDMAIASLDFDKVIEARRSLQAWKTQQAINELS